MQERKEYKMTLTQAQAEKMQQLINMTSFANDVKFEEVEEEEIVKSVVLLDLFTKTFCRYKDDYGRFNDLKFRCRDGCPFHKEDGRCSVKIFRGKYAPSYKDFGALST